ncbi:MAG: gamma-glutamylcyclotransferase [Micromonosporaceae bacterium]|nr:gamma-glutamylcyclotransferase [Micromonosporaceae bacterium]
MSLYAAYGSNLDPGRMQAYCPHSPLVGTGWLEGWRLTFAGGDLGWESSLATAVEDLASRVFVALYDVHPFDQKTLDELEGADSGLYRKLHVQVATLDGDKSAWLYVFTGYEGGPPTVWYLRELADAAEKAGAPDDYVAALRSRPSQPAE